MRKLYRFKEAAEKYYGGDEETLRQALLLGVVRARMELCDVGQWAWWDGDEADLPDSGSSEHAKWRRVGEANYELTGWFYLSHRAASRIAHGATPSVVVIAESEEEECFLGLSFHVSKSLALEDLWFEPSADNGRFRQPEDELLDEMADMVSAFSKDQSEVARFEAAAQAGGGALDFEQIQQLVHDFQSLQTRALVSAALKRAREPQSKGGKSRAEKDPKAQAMIEIEKVWRSRNRPGGKFAADMAREYQTRGIDLTEGGIRNAITRWRKESSS